MVYVGLLKPKWLSFQRWRVCGWPLALAWLMEAGLCWAFVSAPASEGTLLLVDITDAQQRDTCFRSLTVTQTVGADQSCRPSRSDLL